MYKLDSFDYITEHFYVSDEKDHWQLINKDNKEITGIAIEKDGEFMVSLNN